MTKPKTKTEAIPPEQLDKTLLLMAARDEHRAVKAASQAGQPIPATPHLDELHRRHAEMTTETKNKTASGATGGARVRLDDKALRLKVAELILGDPPFTTRAAIVKQLRVLNLGSNERRVQAAFDDVKNGKVQGVNETEIHQAIIKGETAAAKAKTDRLSKKSEGKVTKKSTRGKPVDTATLDALAAGGVKGTKPEKPVGKVAKQTPGAKARAAADKQVTPIPKAGPKKAPAKRAPRKAAAPAKKTVAAARSIRKTTTKR